MSAVGTDGTDGNPSDESGTDVGGDWLRLLSQVESARIVLARSVPGGTAG